MLYPLFGFAHMLFAFGVQIFVMAVIFEAPWRVLSPILVVLILLTCMELLSAFGFIADLYHLHA